jgi:hypothetical protein
MAYEYVARARPTVLTTGGDLHEKAMQRLVALGIEDTHSRQDYLAALCDAQGGSDDLRPKPDEASPWSLRRRIDNEIGVAAEQLLAREGKPMTRSSYLDAIGRVEQRLGRRYRSDIPMTKEAA